jgi:hypothetical protein
VVFRASDTAVMGFAAPAEVTPQLLDASGLTPPYRTLALHRRAGAAWRLELGEMQTEPRQSVLARRQGALVIARGEALLPLEGPLSAFLDLGALSFRPGAADSFRVDAPDRPVVWARRAADPAARRAADPETRRAVLESPWDVVVPPGWELTFGPEAAADHAADLATHLDRLEATAVRGPAPADPLAPQPRWRVRAWLPDGRTPTAWLGRLADGGAPAAWDPADGKVLEIPAEILVTLRNLENGLRRR